MANQKKNPAKRAATKKKEPAARRKIIAKKKAPVKKKTAAKKVVSKISDKIKKKVSPVSRKAILKKNTVTKKKTEVENVIVPKTETPVSLKQKDTIRKNIVEHEEEIEIVPVSETKKTKEVIFKKIKGLRAFRNFDPHHIQLNKVKKGGPKPSGKKPLW